jgi:uncharacterized protein YidB (DUF937 family)
VVKGHCFKLLVFRCLTIIATEKRDRSKGRIINQDSSGTAAVDNRVEGGVGVAEGVVEMGIGESVDEVVASIEK